MPKKNMYFNRELNWAADVPLGNNNPTVVYGKLIGGMPNRSRMARGGLRLQRGKKT